jgi:hypothetical protein
MLRAMLKSGQTEGLLLLLVLCFLATPVRGATLLFVSSEPDEGILLGGGQRFFTENDGTFSASSFHGGDVRLSFVAYNSQIWTLTFDSRTRGLFLAGTYEVADLDVSGEGAVCNDPRGRFVVHEVVFGSRLEVRAFAADFQQRCEGFTGALFGSIRYRSGDIACEGAPDGAPCDDADRCTEGDVCAAGVCVGTNGIGAGCVASATCDAAVCDPASGACATQPAADATPCDDADACTADDVCVDGACAGAPVECDDGDPCTVDACDAAAGCTHHLEPGSCWETRTVHRISASGSANGRDVRCSLRCLVPGTATLLLGTDGTYSVPGGRLARCPTDEVLAIPDEVGTVREGRRGRLFLKPTNLADVLQGADGCSGGAARLRSYRAWLRPAPSGMTLVGKSTARGRVPGPVPLSFKAVALLTGAEMRSGLEPALPPGGNLAECSAASRIRCRVE